MIIRNKNIICRHNVAPISKLLFEKEYKKSQGWDLNTQPLVPEEDDRPHEPAQL